MLVLIFFCLYNAMQSVKTFIWLKTQISSPLFIYIVNEYPLFSVLVVIFVLPELLIHHLFQIPYIYVYYFNLIYKYFFNHLV